MSNYETMSDFEINKAVAEIAYKDRHIDYIGVTAGRLTTPVQVIFKIGFDGDTFDYCNNPSDAWPIIVENGISLSAGSTGTTWNAVWFYNQYRDKNPLRAAMIVYLMMKGGE